VGFALYYFTFSTTLGQRGIHLDDLYVRPAGRGHGAGAALLAHVARIGVEAGCARFEWWALRWNENAIRFYERLGASRMGDLHIFRLTGDSLARVAARAG
jgi:GNAT superfamily N-acetyltransferase